MTIIQNVIEVFDIRFELWKITGYIFFTVPEKSFELWEVRIIGSSDYRESIVSYSIFLY